MLLEVGAGIQLRFIMQRGMKITDESVSYTLANAVILTWCH